MAGPAGFQQVTCVVVLPGSRFHKGLRMLILRLNRHGRRRSGTSTAPGSSSGLARRYRSGWRNDRPDRRSTNQVLVDGEI